MYQPIKEPTNKADYQSPDYCGPKAMDHKSFDDQGDKPEHGAVNDQSKKPQGDDIDRQGQDDQDRTNKGIKDTQQGGSQNQGRRSCNLDSFDEICSY